MTNAAGDGIRIHAPSIHPYVGVPLYAKTLVRPVEDIRVSYRMAPKESLNIESQAIVQEDFLDSIFQGIQLPPVKAEVTTEHHHVEHHEEHHDGHRHSVHHEEHHHEHHEAHRHTVRLEERHLEHHGSVHHDDHLHAHHHDHDEAHHHLEDVNHDHHHDDNHHDHHEHEHIDEQALDAEPDLDADAIVHRDDGHHHHHDHVTELVIGEGVTVDSPTEHILHKSEEIEHLTFDEEHDDRLHEPTAPLVDDAHYETQDLVEEFFDRPVHTLEFENGIDEGDLADSETSEHIPHKHSGHDQVLEELKKRQIAQAIQEHAGDAESEPGTFNTEHAHEHEHHHHHHGMRDVDGNTSQLLGSDDEGTLHADDHYGIESDSDVQPVKALQYQFDSDEVYKVKRTIKAKDNFQHELAETVRRRSENDEHVQEIKKAVESFDREKELAATRPYSLQIANYGNHEHEHDEHHHEHHHHNHDHHDAPKKAPVEPKRRTSVKKKEEQQKRERHESDREVVVHTPLHDTIGRYSSFEPDRQDAIRKEIGQGLNIRDLMGQFEGKKYGEPHAPKPWSRKPLYELLYEDQAQDHVVDYDAGHHHDHHHHHSDAHHEVPKSRSSTLVKEKSRTNTLVKDHHEEHKAPKSRSSTLVKDRHVEQVTPTTLLSPVAHHHHHHDHHHEHVHNGHPTENGHALDLSNSEVLLEEQKPVNELRSKFGHRVGQKHPKPVQRTKSNELHAAKHEDLHHHVEEHHHDQVHHVEQHKAVDHRSLRDAAERHAHQHAHRHEHVHHVQNGHVAVNGHNDVVHHEERVHDLPKSRSSTLVKEKSRASTLVKDHHEEHHHHEDVKPHEDHHHEDHHHESHHHERHDDRYDHEDHHHHDIDQLKKVFSVAPPVAHNIIHDTKAPTLPNFYTHSYLKEPFQSTRTREPPVGSVAAIHKSLASIPTTPVTPPATPLSKDPELDEQSAYPNRAFGTAPRNVREFYKLWGRQAVSRKEEVPSAQGNVHHHEHEHHNHHHHEDHHHFNSLPRTAQIHTA